MLGIDHLAARYPGEISGGQQQRVAIARMIAPEPKVLLFDEPLSNLDAKLRVETRAELSRIHRATGATCVYVTHDQVEAMAMATHIALMREGKIAQFGTPEDLLERPENAFTATFIGTPAANVLEAHAHDGTLTVAGEHEVPLAGDEQGTVQAMYRATSVRVCTQQAAASGGEATNGQRGIVGTLVDQVPMADRWVIGVELHNGTRVTAAQEQRVHALNGQQVSVFLDAYPDALFDQEGEVIWHAYSADSAR